MCGKGGALYIKSDLESEEKYFLPRKKNHSSSSLWEFLWVNHRLFTLFFSKAEHLGVGKIWSLVIVRAFQSVSSYDEKMLNRASLGCILEGRRRVGWCYSSVLRVLA